MRKDTLGLQKTFLVVLFLAAFGCQTPQVVTGPQQKDFFGPPKGTPLQQGFLGPQSTRAQGEQRVLMVAVRFPDIEPRFSLDKLRDRAVTDLSNYVKAQSYGRAWVKAEFMGWIPLPDSLAEYRISPNNFRVDRRRVRKLVEDTMTALEGKVEFSRYQHMLIIPGAVTLPGKGYGMMCYCANPGMLTGVRGNPRFVTLRSKGGQEFSGGVFVGTENAPLGMFAHDFFHALGGVYANKRLVP
ncbi:MAG: hypothetical protein V1689_03280 [Pseudomonadota bacterium]